MTYQAFIRRIFITLTLGLACCYVTAQTGQRDQNKAIPKSASIESPKLVKTQGAGSGANVHGGIQDRAGNLWFCTTGEGVYRYDGSSFTQYLVKNGLSSNNVWSIFEDQSGVIWFGTDYGICRYDGKLITKIPLPVEGEGYSYPLGLSAKSASDRIDVWSIMQDKRGILWFATTAGVYCYDGISFTRFPDNGILASGVGLKDYKVEYIFEDKAGNYWFGGRTNSGVFRYDGKSFERLFPDGELWAWPVIQDKDGNIWFSNWKGAYRYDGKSFTTLTMREGLCGKNITRIIEDRNGNLWFGSEGKDGGICRYDGKSFTHLTMKDGLINDSVWMILEDKNGNLWIGTRNIGLSRYDGKRFIDYSD